MDGYVYPPYQQNNAPQVPQYAYNPYVNHPYPQYPQNPQIPQNQQNQQNHVPPINACPPNPKVAIPRLTPASQNAQQNVANAQRIPNSNSATPQGDDSDDSDELTITQYNGPTGTPTYQLKRDREYFQSEKGVADLRARWQVEWADKPLPPPPPQIYASHEEASEACRDFAKQHGYQLATKSTQTDSDGVRHRMFLVCVLSGAPRPKHTTDPEKRTRNRQSRKLGCPVKIRLQKKRFTNEWIVCVVHGQHNHGVDRPKAYLKPAEYPELEEALHEWHVAELAKGNKVHGAVIKGRARALWYDMPQYSGRPPPNFEEIKWLDDYRLRYDLPGKPKKVNRLDIIDLNDPEAVAADQSARPLLPLTKEDRLFATLKPYFPDGKILDPIRRFVKDYMSRFDASHDWNHILRVVSLAKQILVQESPPIGQMRCDDQVVYLTALLHDICDHKYAKPGESAENMIAETLLQHDAPVELAMKVQLLAKNVSYSNEMKNKRVVTAILEANPELAIVQDADRLDAIGAIGIGRSFTFGGAKQPDRGMDGTIEHFTEKLERLEGLMKTETGRRMARQRTERLQMFRSWWEEENAVFA
ncbi:hypothetical protein MBLNU457_7060t2 [Dothideomycetes sp. NU457]